MTPERMAELKALAQSTAQSIDQVGIAPGELLWLIQRAEENAADLKALRWLSDELDGHTDEGICGDGYRCLPPSESWKRAITALDVLIRLRSR